MRPQHRWIIAVALFIVLLAIVYPVYRIGVGLGGMATDSCSHLPPYGMAYLEILWPVVMAAAAITTAVLILRRVRWRWVWLSLGVGILLSAGCFLLWFPLLMFTC